MAVWLIRAGKRGEQEPFALENGVAVIGWELGNLSEVDSREQLTELMHQAYPDAGNYRIGNYVGQVWAFKQRVQEGDLVVLPLKTTSMIAVGRVTGAYQYEPENRVGTRHTRPVEWIRTDIQRSEFGQDLLYSFGAFMTVCRIQRNNAAGRIPAVAEGQADPLIPEAEVEEPEPSDTTSLPNLEESAGDQIQSYISRKFKAHELANLVAEVLKAQGYQMQVSPPGPDGGVDIIAGRGPMGFGAPRLVVQVKSGAGPVDVTILRQHQGVMKTFGADQGLLVSWGWIKSSVLSVYMQQCFKTL